MPRRGSALLTSLLGLALAGTAAALEPAAPPVARDAAASLAAPAALTATPVSTSAVELEWSPVASAGVVRYEVHRDDALLAEVDGTDALVGGLAPGRRHCFVVIARDAAGRRSAPSDAACTEALDRSPPTVPTWLEARPLAAGGVALSWAPSRDDVGVVGYEVTATDGPAAEPARLAAVAEPRWVDPRARSGATRCYAVRALDAAGNASAPSAPACATLPDRTPPSAPAAVTAAPVGERAVALAWQPSTDDVGVFAYDVLRDGEPVATVTSPRAQVGELRKGTAACFTVVARDAAGNRSAPSAPTCAAPADLTPPAATARVTARPLSDTRVALAWAPASDDVGVVRYALIRDGAEVGEATGEQADDDGLRPGREYCWRVVALDAAGNRSRPSAPACATTPDFTPPAPPQEPGAVARSGSLVTVTWGAAEDDGVVTAYEVLAGDQVVARAGPGALRADVARLRPATEYCWRVRAIDSGGNVSLPSGEACARTAEAGVPTAPVALRAQPVAGRVDLSWEPSPDAGVVYAVHRDGVRVGSTPKPRFSLAAARGGTPCFRVTAVDGAGRASPPTSPACTAPGPRTADAR